MREKFNVFLLCIMLSFTAIAANATQVWDGTSAKWTKGSGTEKDPYLIETPNQLAFLAEVVSAGISDYSGKYFKQTQDFDMKSLVFTPIGILGHPFSGNYNGNNKSISNLQISGDNNNNCIALFGYVSNATIRSVIIEGNFEGTVGGRSYVAGIVAYGSDTHIDNCKNRANIGVIGIYVAGIIASTEGRCVITNCSNTGNVYYSYRCTGGIVGIAGHAKANTTKIYNCSNRGKIRSSSKDSGTDCYSGGIVGYVQGICVLERCSNTDSVLTTITQTKYFSTQTYACSGGIIGYDQYGLSSLNTSSNTGAVLSSAEGANSHAYSGGIIGYADVLNTEGVIKNCYAHCNCISTLKKSTNNGQGTWGINSGITNQYGTIINSYFAGILKGGKCGVCSNAYTVRNCYFNSDCGASTSSKYGSAKTVAQLKSVSMPILLNGSETGTTWVMDTNNSNDGYPIFGWQAAPTYKITATCNESHGSVSGGGNYTKGTVVTLTATPKGGYIFSGWSDGKKTNPRSVTVGTSDATYTALFVKMRYVITVNQDCSVNVQ